jgi:uncharacterized protein YgiM (DUF1202 family)
MKRNCWLIFAVLFSTGLLAQQATNSTPPAPVATPAASPAITNVATPPSTTTNASTTASAKKKAVKKKPAASAKKAEAELRTVPLVGGPATVVASNVNVRGKAGLKGEVIGRLTKGELVTVLEEIILTKSGPDEPSAWAKIQLPPSIHVWVNGTFLEGTNKTVHARKLNVRGGPGENYSVLGTLKRGDAVKEINTKGDWIEIEPPTDGFAFIAAQYLKQEATPTVAGVSPPTVPLTPAEPARPTEPAPTPVTVPDTTPVVPPTNAPVVANTTTNTTTPETNVPPPTVPAPTPTVTPAEEEPLPPRIVQREGVVRGTASIQAPTKFELVSPENGRAINYLHTTARDLDLRRYKGLRIVVTGEEGLDERWRNTPVITIQRIQVLE